MKIPENTSTFTYYNANPRGRKTDDCVIRAICTALGCSYEKVYLDLIKISMDTGYSITDKRCFEKYLELCGFVKKSQPRKTNNKKYTGREFVKIFQGACLANIGGHHITYIVQGKVWDIWDCTDGCIGNYWVYQGK